MAKRKRKKINLCVNIDHVATLRQARLGFNPDPVKAAKIVEKAGAAGITVHLREDRRHINDSDVSGLKKTVKKKFNLEMSLNPEIVKTALKVAPDEATIVPEKRRELTTEGGLDAAGKLDRVKNTVKKLKSKKVIVSLFIDPVYKQIKAASDAGADYIEIHTGKYAETSTAKKRETEINRVKRAVKYARSLGLGVNAGHGLDYQNTRKIASIDGIEDLNTGHSIISRAVMVGLEKAVKEMIEIMKV